MSANNAVERPPDLRLLVGALGERQAWWLTRFTGRIGLRRFGGSFPHTGLRTVVVSVTVAAQRDSDGRLHPDSVHLFRVGGAQEDAIADALGVICSARGPVRDERET